LPKQDNMADHMEKGRPAAPWRRQSEDDAKSLSSQTPRAPMLLFEAVGALFQFDAREPASAALAQ